MTGVICVVSGGLDSVTMAYEYKQRSGLEGIVSFDYGQRHSKEIRYAEQCAKDLDTEHTVVNLREVGKHLTGSSLTDNIDVPDGHYAEDSMKVTVVPNRNMIMLAIAGGIAVAKKARGIATAVHAGDHFVYPDCRPSFMEPLGIALYQGTKGFGDLNLFTPFIRYTKADIVGIGASNGTDFNKTWSCYKGGATHCGKCGTCVERKEAFRIAEVVDPTDYEDPDFEFAAYRG
jgi:7-cyano-7-deazaguanine synthase